MDINLSARLNAQSYAGNFTLIDRYLHTITLSNDSGIVMVQIPLIGYQEIQTIKEFKGIIRDLIGENELYPCAGHIGTYALNAYCISIDGLDRIVVNSEVFTPTTIKDKII